AMRSAAAETSAVAGVAFNYRFVPAIQYAKQLIEDGALGTIQAVRGRYLQDWMVDPTVPWSWRTDKTRAGSGALADIGSHLVDLARFFAGEIRAVSGEKRTFIDERPVAGTDERRRVDVDDAVTVQARFESGASGVFEASRVSPGYKNGLSVTVEGAHGSLRFDLERLNELQVCRHDTRGWETILVTEETDPYLSAWWPPGHVLGWEHTFVHLYADFLRAVTVGGTPLVDFASGRATQAVLDAISRSAESREWTSPR
ncbi:MAG: Gfo/Idh/MocA family oxidoreductase, partial [Halobacteriales archaeon]|nr:Gfo/Idh/MocA family oxidoreductase [Halobacteriales archaeon]